MARLKYWGTFLCSFSRIELIFCLTVMGSLVLLVVASLLSQKSPTPDTAPAPNTAGLGLMILAFFLLSLLVPANIGRGGFVFQRLVLFTILLALLYAGRLEVSRRWRQGTWLIATLLSLCAWSYYHQQYVRIADYVQEYVSVGRQIPEGKTVMPIGLPGTIEVSFRTWPFRHAAGYLGAQRAIVDLDNYEAEVGYFPLIWRPVVNPFRLMRVRDPNDTSGNLDYPKYETRTHGAGQIDYVLTWTCGLNAPPSDRARQVQTWLDFHYDRIASSPRGYAMLWQKKP